MAAGAPWGAPAVAVVGAAVVAGLLAGSFLNVVIHRVPRGASVVRPGSACPHCGRAIRARHNVPVLGWLWLRGRCADCAAPISARYPLVEALTAALFGLLTAYLLGIGRGSAVPAYLYLAAVGVALAVIDVEHRRLPNALTLPSYPVLAVLLGATFDGPALLRAALGAAGLLAFYGGVAFLVPPAMGWGDVKLSGLLGGALAFLSWPTLAVGAFAAFLLGAAYGVALMALGRGTRKTAVPFGPFMLAGALVGILAGPSVAALVPLP